MKYSYFAINANTKKVFIETQRDENSINEILCVRYFSFDIPNKMTVLGLDLFDFDGLLKRINNCFGAFIV